MLYETIFPLHTTNAIKIKLEQLAGKRLNSPLNVIRYSDLIAKLDKISDELTGLVNSIKEEQQ